MNILVDGILYSILYADLPSLLSQVAGDMVTFAGESVFWGLICWRFWNDHVVRLIDVQVQGCQIAVTSYGQIWPWKVFFTAKFRAKYYYFAVNFWTKWTKDDKKSEISALFQVFWHDMFITCYNIIINSFGLNAWEITWLAECGKHRQMRETPATRGRLGRSGKAMCVG